jgi:spore cortex biosynthesis protein YabQ
MVAALSLSRPGQGVAVSAGCLTFLYACMLGVALGILYDVFRILRRALPLPAALVAAQDLLFFFLCAFFSFLFLMAQTDGRIRWFVAVGELLGAVLYHLTVGELVMAVSDLIIGAVRWVLGLLWRFVAGVAGLFWRAIRLIWGCTGAPVVRLADFWTRKIRVWMRNRHKNIKKALRSRRFGLKPPKGLLYNPNIEEYQALRGGRGGGGRGKKKKA